MFRRCSPHVHLLGAAGSNGLPNVPIVRDRYQLELDSILADLIALTGVVQYSVGRATEALLGGDLAVAESVVDGDEGVDLARVRIEEASFDVLARQAPVARDLRLLVAVLRMVGDVERIGDYAVHVAKVARRRYPDIAVPRQLIPAVGAMARTAEDMLARTPVLLTGLDVPAARELEDADDALDRMHRNLIRRALAEVDMDAEALIDVTLLSRYYERIGDHAVSMARRLIFVVTGENAHA